MKSVKIMLLGITVILLGIAFGITDIPEFEVVMIFAVPVGFILSIIGFIKKDAV